MKETAKWLSELKISLSDDKNANEDNKKFIYENTDLNYQSKLQYPLETSEEEMVDKIEYLSTLLDLAEYKKCAFWAQKFLSSDSLIYNELLFYKTYSLYLHNIIRKEEEMSGDNEKDYLSENFDIS